MSKHNTSTIEKLTKAQLRPTRQRVSLGDLLFRHEYRHITAEALHQEAKTAGINVSLATIYNTLHQFTDANLLREISVEGGRRYFDTNTDHHHHFFCKETGLLIDIPQEEILLEKIPASPAGTSINRVEVVIRLSASPS